MKRITLSDHTNEQAGAAANRRQSEYDAALLKYQQTIDARKRRSTELVDATSHAWGNKRYFAWIISYIPRIFYSLSFGPSAPVKASTTREEIVWNAGSDGERRVLDYLAQRLPQDWVVISGYKNPGGEVDIIIISELGVMAIEVKYVNGKVFCDGDKWWRDKYDKYGNLVERSIPIADKRGRGPSVQVNASADRLQRFLNERSSITRVLRCVILSHESSVIGGIKSSTVDSISTLGSFDPVGVFKASATQGSICNIDNAVALISRDHAFHEKRRATDKQQNNLQNERRT